MDTKEIQAAAEALQQQGDKLVYADVGSAGGIPEVYRILSSHGLAKLVLFDPQEDWRSQLPAAEYEGCDVVGVKAALAGASGTRSLHITAAPGCSSLLQPNFEFLNRFPVKEWFTVTKVERLEVLSFADAKRQFNLTVPDIVKLDVQGAEVEVLNGFGASLDEVGFLELEVCLERMYLGQPTLPEVYEFMRAKDFVLRDLQPQGPFEGVAVEFNSFWSRPVAKMSARQARIGRLWQATHNVWKGDYFERANQGARSAVRFTDQ